MSRPEIKLNHAGMRELLRSPQIEAELKRHADQIAGRAGPGHVVRSGAGAQRARAVVITESRAAMIAEAKDRNLTRAAG